MAAPPLQLPTDRPVWPGRLLWTVLALLAARFAHAEPVEFSLAAQPASAALLSFSQQAHCDVLFSYDELSQVQSAAVQGRYEPEAALAQLLRPTNFSFRQNSGSKFVVTPPATRSGAITGWILTPDGRPAAGVSIVLPGVHLATATDNRGGFTLQPVPPGIWTVQAMLEGFKSLRWEHLAVRAEHTTELAPRTLAPAADPTRLEPFVVVDATGERQAATPPALVPRVVLGNLDLPRSENDPLPFKVYDRGQITRSGVVDLNEFLQRELLDSDASTLPPEQNGALASYLNGSSNLNLRGFGSDATIILVNGRRLPESAATTDGMLGAPDVNSIPLSLVEQVQVLPASASALYNGNPVGGVINIILRPEVDGTEIRTTYTDALRSFSAPQSAVTLIHGRTLLQGKLRVRLSATVTQTKPPTAAELGYTAAGAGSVTGAGGVLYGATPNVRSASLTPLFGPGTPSVTSVAPGADGSGGLAAFAGREGVSDLARFKSPGSYAASPNSLDNPLGRRQRRQSYTMSAIYDAQPWLQLGLDCLYTHTVVNRGYDVFTGDLALAATSPFNPFHQDVLVSLNETAPQLGEDYSEAQFDLVSTDFGALLRLPAAWDLSLDAQYAVNIARYRGVAGVDATRWQQLVDQGLYNPLRDTQVFGPPAAFYDQAIVYYGHRDQFVRLGDYTALDTAVRATNQKLSLPTGLATGVAGFDYRRTALANYTQELRYADGSLAMPAQSWQGRTLARLSIFGELQGPVLPTRYLPSWIDDLEADLAVRYIMSANSRESNLAPTLGLKADLPRGFSVRGSATFSNRYPTSAMSRPVSPSSGGGPGVNYASIYDPRRDQTYVVVVNEDLNPSVVPEGAVTQSAGIVYRRGDEHRFRASVDFIDTRKRNELLFLDPQMLLNLEEVWPQRITRAAPAAGDPHTAGYVTSLLTGVTNVSWRHSQNWNLAFDYTWMDCLGGRLDAFGRMLWFQSYRRQLFPGSPTVDEMTQADGSVSGLLKYRSNFGAGWTNRRFGFGLDGHYYSPRILPQAEWPSQGGDRIGEFWQFDAYGQVDLSRWLSPLVPRDGLSVQVRINNLFNTRFPAYANDASGTGVQPYGDWRGRTYSLAATVRF